MDIKKYMKALPVLAALLLTASCTSDDNEIVEVPQPEQTRTVPFTVSVNSSSQTRATVDYWTNEYMFETTDKLWVWGDEGKIYGELIWQGGDEHGYTYSGTFTGSLTVEEGASLEASTTLYATIKSSSDEILGTFDAFKTRGFVPDYTLATTLASDNAEAVQKFSYFKATSTYGAKSFDFDGTQNSSFISFDITLENSGATDGSKFNTTITNGSNVLTDIVQAKSTWDYTITGYNIHAKFIAGFPSGALSNPTVKLGDGYELEFGGTSSLAANKVYKVNRTYTGYQLTASATIPAVAGVYAGGSKTKTTNNIELPYNKTMAELLEVLDPTAAALATLVSDCEKVSGDNCISITGTAPNYSFSATAPGTATYKVTFTVPYFGTYTIDDLVITVAQVPVVTP